VATSGQPIVSIGPTSPLQLTLVSSQPATIALTTGGAGGAVQTVNGKTGALTAGAISSVQSVVSSAVANPFALVLANAAGGAITITPPANVVGVWFEVKRINATGGSVTIAGTVDGTSQVLGSQYATIRVVGDGTNWWIV
jgi:hypothetical protein